MISRNLVKKIVRAAVIASGPLAVLEGSRLINNAPASWSGLALRWGFIVSLLSLAQFGQPYAISAERWVWPWGGLLLLAVGGMAGWLDVMWGDTRAAWLAFFAWNFFLFGLEAALTRAQGGWLLHLLRVALALAAGIVPVVVAQVEAQFAEEEFFVALQALLLSAFWVVMLIAKAWSGRGEQMPAWRGAPFNRRWLGLGVVLVLGIGGAAAVRAYQRSFYPAHAPSYPGISESNPFLCGETLPEATTYEGRDVFQRLLARVEANPRKGAPEYGMLALGTGDQHWAKMFRTGLLAEAEAELFTGPAHSVKSVQYEAALRAYYYPQVTQAFTGLFTASEADELRRWFVAINRRALTAEWVDWMYALAFAKWPEGPYENQENGAGLLAVLESGGLASPDLSSVNRLYLARQPRGWEARFRNSDDAIIYQPEWINNAFFQAQFARQDPGHNAWLSFDWSLLQALPDGAPVRYNHTYTGTLAGAMYLGAGLTGDARYLWLAGRTLDDLARQGGYLSAQPGIERPLDLIGQSPVEGSCLIYGDSGLPTQRGPLAPDKIVFRSGWGDDDTYLMLNLRFTGWHRYKATNTVTLMYQGGPLTVEESTAQPSGWLPTGRSLFRDKRIPRENLNGLLVARTGLSAVLYFMTGFGGPWAQDPPYYATVESFETGEELDVSQTVLENWHGWRHSRTIYFYHQGPIIIVDDAQGPDGMQSAITWHGLGISLDQKGRFLLRADERPVELVILSGQSGQVQTRVQQGQGVDSAVMIMPSADGALQVVSVFLLGDWVGATTHLSSSAEGTILELSHGSALLRVLLWSYRQ